jgi:L-ascorbate metabolism protein UlaG (beta-lactamase superfamily)
MPADHPAPPPLSRRRLTRTLASLPLALLGCAPQRPAAEMPGRPWHHTGSGFRNPPGSPTPGGESGEWFSFFYRNLSRDTTFALPDDHVLPAAEARRGIAAQGDDCLTWLGHASFLLRLDGRTVLIDPFLSDHASPLPPLGPRRYAPAGLAAAELPPIDLLLLSHNHYDHLDLPTIEALPRATGIQVVVPLGLAGYFAGRGYPRVTELDWHERIELSGLSVTALPAIHFSKRGLFDRNQTLWAGFAIETPRRRIYFAGDTAYGPVFPQLGRDLAPFDLGLVPIGAYEPRPLMQGSHATPEEAVQIGRDLRLGRLVGMHWGAIQLTDEPPFEPPGRFRAAALAQGYRDEDAWVLRIGETRAL